MLEQTCKLCTFESTIEIQKTIPLQLKHGICDLCMEDVYTTLKLSHQFKQIELQLRINLRKLRNNLQCVTGFVKEVNSVLEIIETEINAIENELVELRFNHPSILEVLSEYRSLLNVYK
ncbi:hypothetical protein [Vibrio cidicii]|uniref:hypothetical protein n=1 Tax=Vibrio cidicii TaxID=1763883 RepID=UPI0018C336D3|nr:hypothetical protein [Vibrio cidicii]MBG0757499.1 hypothetical protein [Vibrio cidicii]